MKKKKNKNPSNENLKEDIHVIQNNIDLEEIEETIHEDLHIENKVEICKVIFVKDRSFVVDFKGCGLNIKTNGIIDKDLIPEFIEIKYEGEIGQPNFKFFPTYN